MGRSPREVRLSMSARIRRFGAFGSRSDIGNASLERHHHSRTFPIYASLKSTATRHRFGIHYQLHPTDFADKTFGICAVDNPRYGKHTYVDQCTHAPPHSKK